MGTLRSSKELLQKFKDNAVVSIKDLLLLLSDVDTVNKDVEVLKETTLIGESDANIKTKYERNADTNAYTDAEKTKVTNVPSDTNAALSGKETANSNIQTHIASTTNPHGVTKTQVGLGNVDNTSDTTKNAAIATLQNKTLDKTNIADLEDNKFTLSNTVDSTRKVAFNIDSDFPIGTSQYDMPRPLAGSNRLVIRENVPDFGNLEATSISNFTATWGSRHAINATAGDIVMLLPVVSSANQNAFINLTRIDNSLNKVTVIAPLNQSFFDSYIVPFEVFTMMPGSTVNIRSIGTFPVITNINGVATVSRLWMPNDASTAPVIWYNFSNLGSLTLNGLTVSAINNLGTLGATHNLTQISDIAQPTINSTTSPQYATWDGGDSLITGSVDSVQNGTIGTMAGMYTQLGTVATSFYGQAPATGGQLNFHPKWSDGVTYLDMPITSARISGNLGTAFAGDANPYTAVGIRNGANQNLYGRGNPTASLSSATMSGTSTGNAIFRLGDSAAGINKHVGRIYELIYYRIALTNDERDRIAAYMLWKIGQQALINASNPYLNVPPTVLLTTY